uniref:Uncharacterized protein n=1 Tax=Rhodosorus marinus TaxID=101924 RepID=A0A7S0G539_9RHOD|mmetsp:Transcript_20089/g.29182  ORF Transcript_20089/g.29182 Transcript_20089/m.29182 type:complete len:276 (+) Transcript_20089:122-949(+)
MAGDRSFNTYTPLDVEKDQYEYGEDFPLTSSVAESMNVVKLGFLSKVFSILFLEFLYMTAVAAGHLVDEHARESDHRWMLSSIPLLVILLGAVFWFKTSSPLNLVLLALSVFCLSPVLFYVSVSMSNTFLAGALELFLFQQTVTYAFLAIFCVVAKAEFSFRLSFLFAGFVSLVLVIFAESALVHASLYGAFLAASLALLLEAYVLLTIYLQCEELHPDAYDIAVVGLLTQVDVTFAYLCDKLTKNDRRQRISQSLSNYGSLNTSSRTQSKIGNS